ncbi:MAG: DUF6788 family protein [Acidimicrobiales bacterium]
MTERRISPAELERLLAECRRDYDAVKARVAEVGFICEGSLVERRTSCGKPTCRCADPAHRHGPYHQLSWKEGGRTVSRRLSADEARLYRDWITNRRQLDALLHRMKELSRHAGEYLLDGVPTVARPTRSRRNQRS